MIILAYDIETTGLDKQKDRIIEVGLALYSTGQKRILESTGFLVQSDGVLITDEITEINGITQAAVDRFGYEPAEALDVTSIFMEKADAVATHNGGRFDLPITCNTAKRLNRELPERLLIDTMTDIPGVRGQELITMLAKKGVVNADQHGAEMDARGVITLLRLHERDGISIDSVVERAKSPIAIIQSHQDRNHNQQAKKLKFRWNPEYKIWWKAVKEVDIQEIANRAPFGISVLDKSVTQEQLEDQEN
jgi:DNA polymerase III alpha subunit (gram-positive type)